MLITDTCDTGDYYRLTDPFKPGNMTAWQLVSKDKKSALLSVFVTSLTNNGPQEYTAFQFYFEAVDA